MRGHAIECRINAEDPLRQFAPSPGTITTYLPPSGPGVRVDSACYQGYTIPPFYDSMVAKLIVWAPTREQAIARMLAALDEYEIDGVRTTIPFHIALMQNDKFRNADVTTRFLEENHIL
ncbi:hypothetical protein GCM10025858_03540 [Alicyclobacillus sacchari]|nr:hypothetical protein GCM10025858_03540 [Alicyclobacillus sacchari]